MSLTNAHHCQTALDILCNGGLHININITVYIIFKII